jgi:SAM-dependent methyltransferase
MKEHDIRPGALLQRYLDLSARDATLCFGSVQRSAVPCVACGGTEAEAQFEKFGFSFSMCGQCASLFQTPRPTIEAFEAFYRDSESSRFWAEEFFPAVAEARRERIFRPRVQRLAELCAAKGGTVDRLIEIGSGYGIFLEEWRNRFAETQLLAVEPSRHLAAECRKKGFEVIEAVAEHVGGYDGYADLVVCFEVLEHVHGPLAFIKTLARFVRPGGYVFISSLCADGFDIQMLWDRSNSIFPPHHINFLSVSGFRRLFDRAGLEDVDISTPGQLDVDIVRNAATNDGSVLSEHRFIRALLANEGAATAFQKFLAENQLSSHVWVIGRRPM